MASAKALAAAFERIQPLEREAVDGGGLSVDEQREVVETFITLIEGLYAHLPRKRATYGQDPVQRLRALRQRLGSIGAQEFHESMAEIVTDLRDAHTRYIGPQQVQKKVAFLPFLVESYREGLEDRYLVSKVFSVGNEHEFSEQGFEKGVELTHWNGVPIDRAVERYADRETGGRPDARRARALESLTLRPLRYALVPDEEWVIVSFMRGDDGPGEVRLAWSVVEREDLPHVDTAEGSAQLAYAGNPLAEAVRRAKKFLFATDKWQEEEEERLPSLAESVAANKESGDWFTGEYQDSVAARVVSREGGDFGLLRLWSFDLRDDAAFIQEVTELLDHLPRTGLVIDLRGNPGGLIWAAERLLQLFTPNRIEPTRFSILATDLTRTLAAAQQNRQRMEPWRRSLDSATFSGALHSRSLPLTRPDRCNDLGQFYPGPVVAVVDANTYSAGDLFAAGFVDNRVGTMLSVDKATGGGGANVWNSSHVSEALEGTSAKPRPLPHGVDYTVAFRRAVRSGVVAETGIEDVGIPGHISRPLTKRDLTDHNADLLDFCGQLLASEPLTDLKTEFEDSMLKIETSNLDRVDVFVDGHPLPSQKTGARSGIAAVQHEIGDPWYQIEVIGYAGNARRQRRLLRPMGG